eukprot:TRINITY_DN64952_c0_g1_i1.p1 TRINITY_DN64952_c0_g1~~TRINITY_DN64952_c0_g1_i1.p1  ORF type:complete len:331 (-),score=19.20 TRINITY_DN64952_c0_g1_i1:172-1164(-)
MAKGGWAAVPPQVCALALGSNGLSGALAHWARIHQYDIGEAPLYFAILAVLLASVYVTKAVLAPRAVLQDLSEPGGLPQVAALPPALQSLALRFLTPVVPLAVTQGIIISANLASLSITTRFLYICYRRSVRPDPSWFPACLLAGMTLVTSHAAGLTWLQEYLHWQFVATVTLYVPLKLAVAYRILLSPERLTVAPHAGMNALMAPASFYTVVHLSSFRPGGEAVGLALFADSTLFVLLTVWLLYKRRGYWASAFHPTYASFTFPVTSTATAAVLAAERLTPLAGTAASAWGTFLLAVATVVVPLVIVRYLWFISVLMRKDVGTVEKKDK